MSTGRLYLACLLGLFLVVVALPLALPQGIVPAAFIEPGDRVYGFKVDLVNLGIVPKYVSIVDESRVAVIGLIGEVYGVAVLRMVSPHVDPLIEDLYPLTGIPTYVAKDGYPVTRMAVGTDKGEVLLFKVDRGRITKHLYLVLGADFYVDKLYLAKDPAGNVKIVALTVEGGSRGYPCLNCYVYVLDEEAQGILRIGPKVGKATPTCEGLKNIQVQDVAPLVVYAPDGFYWDASNVLVAHIPQVISLVFNVTYLNETTGELIPLPATLVEVSLAYGDLKETRVVYGVNADEKGVARVPIPVEQDRKLTINLTIRNLEGSVVWNYTFVYDPQQYVEVPSEIPLPTAVLPTSNVDRRPAMKIYGMPPFLAVKLDLVDMTYAPFGCPRKGSADFYLTPSAVDIAFMRGRDDIKASVTYMDTTEGLLNVVTTSLLPSGISKINAVDDYVGSNVRITASGTYSNGNYVIIGLSDGRLRIYVSGENGYRLRNIYTMGSPLVNLVTIPGVEGYTYVAISASGIQVFKVEPYPLPVYRNLASLYLSMPGYIHGDVSANIKAVSLADQHGMIVVKNSDIAVKNGLVLTMDRFMAKDVELAVNMPRGEEVGGTLVVLNYPGGSAEYRLQGNSTTLKNIIPGVEYTVNIYSPVPYVYNGSLTFTLSDTMKVSVQGYRNVTVEVPQACCKLVANMLYKEFTVKLRILDEISGVKLIAPVDIYVDGKELVKATNRSEHVFGVLWGEHVITVSPSKGFEGVYQVSEVPVIVNDNMELNVRITRAAYYMIIKVADVYGELISPVDLVVEGPESVTKTVESTGLPIQLLLPYGEYSLKIIPHNTSIYIPYTMTLLLDSPRSVVVTVQRVSYKLNVNVIDRFGVVGRFELYANETKIAENVGERITVEIPYGSYVLKLVPVPGWDKAYDASKPLTITVTNDTSVTIYANRKSYRLRVVVVEEEKPVGNAIVYIYSLDIGDLITILTTDISGTIETNLPYGNYKVVVEHGQYIREEIPVLAVDKDINRIVALRPTVLTILWRYVPVIAVLIGVGVGTYIAMRVRTIIARRLVEEEMF
ncbi:MAG: hypothetical protein QXU03_05265 [Desulfurococcaceae archaeon]